MIRNRRFIWGLLALAAVARAEPDGAPLFSETRSSLYTQAELWQGFDPATGGKAWDDQVYRQYVQAGRFEPSRSMARARDLHDDGITAALSEYIKGRHQPVVAVLGSARLDLRGTADYRRTVLLGYQLAKAGFLVVTGGGPGEMEAANLGAYLSGEDPGAVDEALRILRARALTDPEPTVCRYPNMTAYTMAMFDVTQRFPRGSDSLGIPTWFFGHEPPNRFAVHVAKYFSNAIREDILLAVATEGTVYVEGMAGMRQEIFQKAAQENFASFGYVSPMVFLGAKAFGDTGLFKLVYDFAEPASPVVGSYRRFLKLTDDVDDAVAFLRTHPPAHYPIVDGGVGSPR